MPKLPNSILLQIVANIGASLKKINISLNCEDPLQYRDSVYLPEYVSGMMITIICYCFLGDSDIACLFSHRLVKGALALSPKYNYLTVHSLYWCARSLMSEGDYKSAE